MGKLAIRENLSSILNNRLANNFIDELIVNNNIEESLSLFSDDVVILDNYFSSNSYNEITHKDSVSKYLSNLINKDFFLFQIKSREIKIVAVVNDTFNITINLSILQQENNFKALFCIELTTHLEDDSYLINDINFHPTTEVNTVDNCMKGGLTSFSFNNALSIKFVSNELLTLLGYSHWGEIISDLDGKLSSALLKNDKKVLTDAINDSISSKSFFKTSIKIKNTLGFYIDVNVMGQTLMIEHNKYEVFAIICSSNFILHVKNYTDNIRFQMITLAQSYQYPVFWQDLNSNFLGCNVSFLEQFKLDSVKLILNKYESCLFDDTTIEKHKKDLKRLLDNKLPQITVDEKFTLNSDTIFVKTTKVPLYRKGEVYGIVGIIIDVTREEKLKQTILEKQVEIDYVFSLSNHGYFIKDTDLRFIKVNNIFCDIVGISMDEIVGKKNSELLIDGTVALEPEQRILREKEMVVFTYSRKINDEMRYYNVTENPLLDENGEIIKILGNVIDVTEITNKSKKLNQDYNRALAVMSNSQSLFFLTVDMFTGKITAFSQRGTANSIVGLEYSNEIMSYNSKHFLYERESKDYLRRFNFNSLLQKMDNNEEIKTVYTLRLHNKSILKVLFSVDFTVNPFTTHTEANIKSTDITEYQYSKEIVEKFGSREFDFIIRLSVLVDFFVVVYSDKTQYDFEGYEDNNSIDTFIDILYKNTISERPDTKEWISLINRCFELNQDWNYNIDTKDGRRKNIIVRTIDSENKSIIIVSQDITERTRKERDTNLKLEKLAKEAVEANNAKSDFFARMSHDMRTPLTAIMGLSDFGANETNDESLKQYFIKIKNSSEYLKTLLNDVLDMQVIEKGDFVLNPTYTKTLERLASIKTIIYPRALEKKISLEVKRINDGPQYIYVDVQRIEQILINILTNALKYTKRNGHIVWSIEFLDGMNPYTIHTISDNGVGMSEEFQKIMFDSFSREENVFSSAEGGSGLGLSIVKNILNIMGGSIKCTSKLDKGTTFEIHIPIKVATKEEYEQNQFKIDAYDSQILMNRDILVCEDNTINIVIIKKILSEYNMNVDVAENGEKGVLMAQLKHYDAILMDIRMPIMDGLESTKAIRKTGNSTPIIAISANAYTKDVESSLSSGMNAHLSKPINKEELFYTITQLLK